MVIKLGSNFLMAGDEHKKMCKFLDLDSNSKCK